MKTIILDQPGTFRLTETAEPAAPGAGEVVVRVRSVGVCGTDLHAYRGKQPFFTYPRIVGHELGIEVAAIGAGVTNVRVGDRCAIQPYLECGTCIACRRGKPNCCVSLKVLGVHIDGGMRERFTVPAAKLYPSATLTLDQLALVETLGIGAHAVARAEVGATDTVLVIGAGPIGLSVVQFASAAGATVIVMDRDEHRLAFCRQQFQVPHTLTGIDDPVAALQNILGGELPTVVIDATGNPASMMAAFQFPCHGGKLVFVGLFQGDVTFNDPNFHRRELTLFGSRNATGADFAHIIAQVEAGRIKTDPWITHRAKADDLVAEFARWTDPAERVIKAVVEF
ncbi:MAG: zinc-binding alcohol dehydrogenase family protein [Planctomycetes bacterium]|nr:zinc-binding alcohol dehydrogenase family protein [Planctomycetota bacterium]